MSETLRLVLTKFTDETMTIFGVSLLLTMALIVVYWFYNRKKFHELKHEIPASVVKNYLDSIIQNSNSLKSSLFRGGGLDIGNGIPSVVPVGDLPSSSSIGIGAGSEELNQKNAEIASLSLKLNDKTKLVTDLEKRLSDLSASKGGNAEEVNNLQAKIRDLESQISKLKTATGGDANLQKEVDVLTQERNELKERLKEYEIIEEDLANLKRLQQENDQLRAEIAALKKGVAVAPVAAVVEPEPEVDLEAEMAKAIADSKPAPKPAAPEEAIPQVEGEQKSAEELLSEFEKMLG